MDDGSQADLDVITGSVVRTMPNTPEKTICGHKTQRDSTNVSIFIKLLAFFIGSSHTFDIFFELVSWSQKRLEHYVKCLIINTI